MAKPVISDEELQFKKRARRRLIGAITLVLLLVVFLPMLLDSEPKPLGDDVSIQIPDPRSSAFVSRVVPADATPPAAAAPEQQAAPQAAVPAPAAPAAAPAAAVQDTVPPPAPAAAPQAAAPQTGEKPQAESKTSGEVYVVQLGAFSNAANARQLKEKLTAAGVKSYTEILKAAQGDKTRVRAGPFATREAAEQARARVKKLLGVDGPVASKPEQ